MRKSKKKVRFIALVGVLLLVVVLIIYLVVKNFASADTATINYPAWMDPQVVQKATSVWNSDQASHLNSCISLGPIVQANLTAQESTLMGSAAKAFVMGPWHPSWGAGFYDAQFRVVIQPYPLTTNSSGVTQARFKVAIGNITSKNEYLSLAKMLVYFIGIPNAAPTTVSTSGYTALGINGGQQATLKPGDYVTADTGLMDLASGTTPIYSIFHFSTASYFLDSAGTPSFDTSGAMVFGCAADPFSVASLSSSVLASVTPVPSVVPSTTYPSSTPTPPAQETNFTFPKGFTAFGNTKTVSTDLFATQGLYVYQFDGENNKWLISGTDTFSIQAWKGYYIYNPSTTAKSVSVPYDLSVANMYALTKGWNMLYSVNSKSLAGMNLQLNSTTSGHINDYIAQGLVNSKVFIINNDRATSSCEYFTLWAATDTAANCSASAQQLANVSQISAGKTFWVYVK